MVGIIALKRKGSYKDADIRFHENIGIYIRAYNKRNDKG